LGDVTVRGRAGLSGWCSPAVGRSDDPSMASCTYYNKRRRRGGDLCAESIERRKAHVEAAIT
jgi:hypothetical protein